MTLELWVAFAAASLALLMIPGPTVMLVVSYAMGKGRRTGFATVPGVVLGDFVAMTASLLGAGALLSASAELFTLLKWIGAAYLIWLGIKMWRSEPEPLQEREPDLNRKHLFLHAFVVTALNPKGIIFFVAFVPQFVSPTGDPFWQWVMLELTFLSLVTICISIWVICAGTLRQRLQSIESVKLANRIGGTFLMGAGLLTATMRRAS